MNRKDFLTKLGIGAMAFTAAPYIQGCKKEDEVPACKEQQAPAGVDFTIDLTAELKNNGEFVYKKNSIIIARTSSGEFIALSKTCTHTGCTVEFDGTNFPCPCHGSKFESNGCVINGPATSPLKKYNTQLTGNSLRIFS